MQSLLQGSGFRDGITIQIGDRHLLSWLILNCAP
jgi:hypothetical protein